MDRQVIKSVVLGEEYYLYRHPSGLGILLYPMPRFSSAYAVFSTNYGSVDTTFKTPKDDSLTTVPEGIAHFLEHKLFESEDGDAFEKFSKTGASANAFTSFEKTSYLFSTTAQFEECLKTLVTFVQEPYFTQKSVEKEQGIIGQEISMYLDDPGWRVFFNLLRALYQNHPVRVDIAGTVESISKIDAELLYRCYHAFYNPSNMVLCVAGSFDLEKAVKIIEDNLKDFEKTEVSRQTPEEPDCVMEKEHVQNLTVSIPLFNIGYKEIPVEAENELAVQLRYELILCAVAGKGSRLYRELYDEALINDTFGKEVFCGRGYLATIFSGESKNPKLVQEKLCREFARLKEIGIDHETFKRVRRMLYGTEIMTFNDVHSVGNELATTYFEHHSVFDSLDVISNMTLEVVNDLFSRSFREDRMAISIVNPVADA